MPPTQLLKRPAKLENLPGLVQTVAACAAEFGFTPQRVTEIELACEEALSNIVNYAYPDRDGEVTVICDGRAGTELVVEIQDDGLPFDVSRPPGAALEADLNQRRIGGLGLYLIHRLADRVIHARQGGTNTTRLLFRSDRS